MRPLRHAGRLALAFALLAAATTSAAADDPARRIQGKEELAELD